MSNHRPRSVTAAAGLFTLLSKLLPSTYRHRHADEAVRLMVRLAAEAHDRRGAAGVLIVAARAVLDLMWRLPAEYAGPEAIRAMVDTLGRDSLYALRSLRGRPLSTAAAVATLALGIGLNAAVFSVVDWVLLRPLPYHAPEELVRVFTAGAATLTQPADLTYTEFEAFSRAGGLRASSAFSMATRVIRGPGIEPAHVMVARVAGDLFTTLGVYPETGRGFGPGDTSAGAAVVVLSETRWRTTFAGDPAIVGRVITIDGAPHTIAGIMPAGRGYPPDADLWRPLTAAEHEDDDRELLMIARLRGGVPAERASVELGTVAGTVSSGERTAWAEDLQQSQVRNVRAALTALVGSAALILLMACANVASLVGARSADRVGELAVRGALGASRGRLARQLLIESVLLAAAGGVAGLLAGGWTLQLLIDLAPGTIPRIDEVTLDTRVVIVSLAATCIVGLVVGLAPAFAASRVDLRGGLSGARSNRATSRARSRRVLVAAQVSIAIVVIVSAALLGKTLQHLLRIDHGFAPERLIAVNLYLRDASGDDVRPLYRTLIEQAESVPGVRSAAIALSPPTWIVGMRTPVVVAGNTVGAPASATLRPITSGYFDTAGIPVSDGRAFGAGDRQNTARVAVANQSFVRTVLAGRPAVGTKVTTTLLDSTFTIVGVVADVTPAGESDQPALYLPLEQVAIAGGDLLIRTVGDPQVLIPALTTRLRSAAPALALDRIHLVADTFEAGRSVNRFNLQLAAAFALIALLLAAIGVYGLTAGEVNARWRELALRLALGAPRRVAFWTAVRPAAGALAAGVIGGIALSLGIGRWMTSLLHGVNAADPVTLMLVPLVLGAVGMAAGSLAAARVLRSDPATTLRQQ